MTDDENKCDKDVDGLFVPWFGWWLWDAGESRELSYASDSADDPKRLAKAKKEGEKK